VNDDNIENYVFGYGYVFRYYVKDNQKNAIVSRCNMKNYLATEYALACEFLRCIAKHSGLYEKELKLKWL
jgi:hypothetical protein